MCRITHVLLTFVAANPVTCCMLCCCSSRTPTVDLWTSTSSSTTRRWQRPRRSSTSAKCVAATSCHQGTTASCHRRLNQASRRTSSWGSSVRSRTFQRKFLWFPVQIHNISVFKYRYIFGCNPVCVWCFAKLIIKYCFIQWFLFCRVYTKLQVFEKYLIWPVLFCWHIVTATPFKRVMFYSCLGARLSERLL